jgi:uncharacterized damage-inducible protein DinB
MHPDITADPHRLEAMKGLVLEMWDEGVLWWQRLKLQEAIVRPAKDFSGSLREAFSAVQVQDTLWESWVAHAQQMALDHVFQYYDSKRYCHKLPVYKMLLHIFNHASQCRGALLDRMREAGLEEVPAIDLISKGKTKRYSAM